MKRGKSFLITSGVAALLALLASAVGASELGVCPPYSKTFGPGDPTADIEAFLVEANSRPGGGTLRLLPGNYSYTIPPEITGVLCVEGLAEEGGESVAIPEYHQVGAGGILTFRSITTRYVGVGSGGLFFADKCNLGATPWGNRRDVFVAMGAFAAVTSSVLTTTSNDGTLILRDTLVNGARCDFGDGIGVAIVNAGHVLMERVSVAHTRCGKYCFQSGAIINSGTASLVESTVTDNDPWYDCNGTAGGIYNTGYLEVARSVVAGNLGLEGNLEEPAPLDCSGDPVIDLGHNVFGRDGGCTVNASTSLEADPGGVFVSDSIELMAGSPAIDLIPLDLCPETDALGRPRTDGNGDGMVACDAGALEFSGTAITVKSPPFWLEYGELDVSVENDLYVVLMSNATFDPADVVVESVVFGDTDALPRGWSYVDRNKDGVADLRLRYRLWDVDLACGQQEIEVSASTTDGRVVAGVLKLDVTGCSD